MSNLTRPTPKPRTGDGTTKAAQRRAAAEARAAAARRSEQRRLHLRWGGVAVTVAALIAGGTFVATRNDGSPGANGAAAASAPEVGGDLHTVTTVGNALYVGGHDGVAVSRDQGRKWTQVPSLKGADAMGWAVTSDAVLAGGHPGLYRSTDDGATFDRVTGDAAVPDVHALGGTGGTVYLASPQAGLLASTDGGQSWQVRNSDAGRSFMGTMLVDPKDTDRLIAPDMSGGLTTSSDGGRTWTPLGGPMGAMAAAWNPTDTRQIVAVGMNGGARSTDGGTTWRDIQLPEGTSAVSYDPGGLTLYAGVLDGQQAITYRSTDHGASWTPTT